MRLRRGVLRLREAARFEGAVHDARRRGGNLGEPSQILGSRNLGGHSALGRGNTEQALAEGMYDIGGTDVNNNTRAFDRRRGLNLRGVMVP